MTVSIRKRSAEHFIGKETRKSCSHDSLVLGAHPSFRRGFLCLECKQFIGDPTPKAMRDYVGVIWLLRLAE